MLFVKICILTSIILTIISWSYGKFVLKKCVDSIELLVSMGVLSKDNSKVQTYLFKRIILVLAVVILNFLSGVAAIIGMFFIGLWYLSILCIITSLRFSAKDKTPKSETKKKKIDTVMNAIQWIIFIVALIIIW